MGNHKSKIISVISMVFAVIFLLGIHFVFHACGPKEDGSYMNCHKAELLTEIITICLFVIFCAAYLIGRRTLKIILLCVSMILEIVMMLNPQVIIRLCTMKDMRCFTMLRPAAIIGGILFLILSVLQCFLAIKDGD